MIARRLIVGGVTAFPPLPPQTYEALYNGTIDAGITYEIGAATFDGATWTKGGSNPVLSPTFPGWEADGVKDPALIWDGSQYVMYYAGYAFSGMDPVFQIGRATAASLDGPWTKDAGNPIGSVNGSLDDDDQQAPFVFYSASPIGGHSWWMWYVGNGTNLLLAHSDDGVAWTGDGEVDAVGPVVYHGGTFYLFNLSLYTFTTPTGTYTPDAGNPLLVRRGLAGNVSATLAANASAGATSITVSAGALDDLEVGEPLFIVDGNSGPEITRVTSVGSTSIGVEALVNSYQTADGATARTMAYTIVDAHALIRKNDGTWEAFGTTFRPGDGLTFSGNPLWEGSLRYTANDATGPWSYDFDTGLIFPMTALGDAWDSISAENLSVIPTP